MHSLDFSVIICTRNRSRYLADALRTLSSQTYPREQFEIIIVDNGSNDGTQQTVENFHAARLTTKYVYEPQIGLSHARNCGAEAARGEVVIYIDDDVLTEQNWLAEIARVYLNSESEIMCVGGNIQLLWENGDRPNWLPVILDGYLGSTTELGNDLCFLPPPLYPHGGNLSVRRSALEKIGGFSPQLGRVGTNLLSNEEAGLCNEIRSRGGEVWYNPAAVVHHRVQANHINRRRLLRRAYWQGISDILVEELQTGDRVLSWKRLAVDSRELMRSACFLIDAARQRNARKAFEHSFFFMCRLGRISRQAHLI